MRFTVVITKDKQPRSFRWTIRQGINQANELPPSRAERDLSHARRAAERVFGPLAWRDAQTAGSVCDYIVECAEVNVKGEDDAASA